MKFPLAFLALTVTALAQPKPKPAAADPDANSPAASPAQNRAVKLIPPPGVAIPEKDRAELTAGVAELGKEIAALKLIKFNERAAVDAAARAGNLHPLLPDIEVFHKAVDWALRHDEFYDVKQVATARELLAEGKRRAAALREGKAPWTTATGLVVRGYRSRIDGSVQPFGVVVPPTWKGPADKKPRATWIWNHGRNDKLSELAFVAEQMKKPGEFTPADTFVVRPYGRYCNATKFAGEVDVFESLDAARRAYPVDNEKLVNAGFSMGGASAWHLGVHHSGLWAVTHPGAGFAESAEYAGVFAEGKTPPPWWEVILYRWYDATVCAANFANHPVLAYHGSEDKQKQATEIMKRFAEKEGVKIEEFIGPGVGHKYEPETKKTVEGKIQAVLDGTLERHPTIYATPYKAHLTCYSLRYGDSSQLPSGRLGISVPLSIAGMEKQWERADVTVEVNGKDGIVHVTTRNANSIRMQVPTFPVEQRAYEVRIDGQLALSKRASSIAVADFEKIEGKWIARGYSSATDPYSTTWEHSRLPEIRKNRGRTGPIDDAFMDSFLFVKPSGKPLTPALGEWTQSELAHATKQWRAIFRGDAPTVDDTQVGEYQILNSNLVLWGDPSSNAVLKKIADKLPVKWTKDGLEFGGKKYDAATHMPILIFPNPLNPRRYVVLNSGFTFSRAAASGTNSLQTPKLPDWAIVDTTVPPDDKFPGKIVDAGFFDEQWRFTTERPK